MDLSFSKYEALGNDFIFIDDRSNSLQLSKEIIQYLCHRNLAIGADGVVFLRNSESQDFKMTIFNSDGKEAKMCGNALCCLIKFLNDLGCHRKNYQIETKAYNVQAGFVDDKIYFLAPKPKVLKENYKVKLDGKYINVDLIDSGVNHLIYYIEDLENLDVENVGRYLRNHEDFLPVGANVNFVKLKNNNAQVRVFEKGVEKETLACTTGAIATAYSIKKKMKITTPIDINFLMGKVIVSFEGDHSKIVNQAHFCFSGKINLKNFIQS